MANIHTPRGADPAEPLNDISSANDGPIFRLSQGGSGNAVEVVGANNAPLWSVNKSGAEFPSGRGALDRRLLRTASTPVTTWQAGHGWTSSVGAGVPVFTLNDTADFVLGSQALKIDTPISAAGYVSKTGMAAINTTGKVPRLWVKVENISTIVSLVLYLGDTTFTNFWQWNVWQSGSTQFALDGEWVVITLNWSDATVTGSPTRSTVTDARVRLNAGPSGAATAHINALEFVAQPSAWPNGVVSLTFDDGWTTQFTQAKPKMDQYLYGGTAYPIIDQVGEGTHTYMTLAELQALETYSGWEMGVHAYTIANHNLTYAGMDPAIVEAEWVASKRYLQTNGLSGAFHMAWPLGAWDAPTLALAKKHFVSARGIYEKHQETLPVADRHRLRIRNVQNTTTTVSLQADIDSAFTNGEWLILMFHRLESPANAATQYTPANFATVIDYLATKTIPVRTVGDVMATL